MTSERIRRLVIATLVAITAVVGLGALMPVDAAPSGDVTYLLAWDTDGVEWGPEGWSTTSDLGYEVTVTEAALVTFSVTMVACEHDHGGWFGWLAGLFSPAVAEAGHSADGDAALAGGPVVEDLDTPQEAHLGTATVDEPAYCEGHTNWGSADDGASTLTVIGSWTAPDGAAGVIDIEATIDWGAQAGLTVDGSEVHLEVGDPAEIVVVRSLESMFDGIDFEASPSADDQAMAILRAIAAGTAFEVTGGTAHA